MSPVIGRAIIKTATAGRLWEAGKTAAVLAAPLVAVDMAQHYLSAPPVSAAAVVGGIVAIGGAALIAVFKVASLVEEFSPLHPEHAKPVSSDRLSSWIRDARTSQHTPHMSNTAPVDASVPPSGQGPAP